MQRLLRLAGVCFSLAVTLAPSSHARAASDNAIGSIDLSPTTRYLADPRGDFDFATVRRLSRADFDPVDAVREPGTRPAAVWIRLEIPPQVPEGEWWLSVGPATIDTVALHAQDPSGHATVRELGASTPFADRPVDFRTPVFPLRIDATPDSRTLHLRISGSNAAQLSPVLWQPTAFAGMAAREYALWGAYFGVLALLVAFTLFFWLELRSVAYLRYSLYLGAFFSTLWLLEGFGAQWLLPGAPEAAVYLTRATAFVAMGYTLWFSLRLLELERQFPRLHRGAAALSLALGSGAVAILFLSYDAVLRVALVTVLAWQPVFFALLGYQWRRRPDLRLTIIAFAPQMLALALVAPRHVGALPPGLMASHALKAAGIVHAAVLSLALMRRMRDTERRSLALARESEDRLDRKVGERTSELADANRRLRSEIAERRVAQAELASSLASERKVLGAQRDFIAMVSHEFRTPLAVIKTAAQRLRAHPALQSLDFQHRLGRMDRATARMAAMMETYLADDRMRTPERARQATRFSIATLLSAAAEHHGTADSRVRLVLPDEAPDTEGDLALLTVALSNLIDNALKYSTAPTPVSVTATCEAGGMRFRVADFGPGVTEPERERIFQRYVRGSASSGRGGAGLGLHLAQEIARLHGGDIVIEQSDSTGSIFALTLPHAEGAGDALPSRAVASAGLHDV